MNIPKLDDRSETTISTLRERAQPWFRAMIRRLKEAAAAQGHDVRAISGNRTWAEQDALFAKGRTAPGSIVTNARGGQSNHNYGIAVDVGVFKDGKYLPESPLYKKLGPEAEALGLEWGGRWTGIVDTPHYQIKIGRSVSQLRDIVKSQGWGAVDALIPAFVDETTPEPEPAEDSLAKVSVIEAGGNGNQVLDLDAWFVESRVWVAIRDWANAFGGTVVQKGAKWELVLNGGRTSIKTITVNDRAAAKFADINAVLGWDFTFDGNARPRTLTVHAD